MLFLRSAQEDYVTVVESDLESKENKDSEGRESCQTLTLSGSGSQSNTASTQTDISLDEKLICSEIFDGNTKEQIQTNEDKEMIEKLQNTIQELESELSKSCMEYRKTLEDNEKLSTLNNNLKELIKTSLVGLRNDCQDSKDAINSFKSNFSQDVEIAWADVHKYVDKIKGNLSEMSTRTAKEYEDIIKQLNEKHEQEIKELIQIKSQLELEKNTIKLEKSAELAKVTNEVNQLQLMVEEYKAKCEEQQYALTRQKDVRVKTEEEQQTRFNSIIQSLTKEKKVIVGQLNEKVKAMEQELQKQYEKLTEYEVKNQTLLKEQEYKTISLQEKDTNLQILQAKLKEAETKWNQRESEFRDQLEKEKANALLLLEVERQMWEAGHCRSEDTDMMESR